MTSLTMHPSSRCPYDGATFKGLLIGAWRVNKNTLRATRPTLQAGPWCPLCELQPDDVRWRLNEESEAKVAAARARKGWAA